MINKLIIAITSLLLLIACGGETDTVENTSNQDTNNAFQLPSGDFQEGVFNKPLPEDFNGTLPSDFNGTRPMGDFNGTIPAGGFNGKLAQ